jgi:hypothetical protein
MEHTSISIKVASLIERASIITITSRYRRFKMGFNYGTEEVAEGGGAFKNPEIGDHSAVLRSIIHCGMFRETYLGEKKKPAPQVVAIFELKDEEDFEDDAVTPLTIHKSFPLKKGDKAFMTKFIAALDPKGEAGGFDDLIGKPCQVNCKGSKQKNEDGTPKYVNFGGISSLLPKFAKMIGPLTLEGSGHLPFDLITKEAVLELNPILDVAMILIEGDRYAGSKAEEIVNAIRKENPEFAIMKKKTEVGSTEAQPEKEANLKEDEEF